jgi:hypothetical protein
VAAPNIRNRLVAEAAIVVVVVFGVWAFLYGPFLYACCGAADLVIIGVLWSASQIGGFLIGNVKDPGRDAVLVGLIIEALGIWALCRWGMWTLRRKRRDDV